MAVRAFGLLVAANEQLDFPAARFTGILVQRRSVKAFDPAHRFTAAETKHPV
jgi:hypothetical protein